MNPNTSVKHGLFRDEDAPLVLDAELEMTSDAIVVVDVDACIAYCNSSAERLFGLARDAVLRRELSHFVAQPPGSVMATALEAARLGEESVFDGECRRREGRLVAVLITVAPVRDARGEARAVCIAMRDKGRPSYPPKPIAP